MFPEGSGEIGSERFDPAFFLLQNHQATTFDDLKVGKELCKVLFQCRFNVVENYHYQQMRMQIQIP